MTSEWRTIRAADFIDFNPRLSLKKGDIATKVAMDKLKPFTKKIPETEKAEFNGGAKFCNGDTVMARITPCLENGKTAYVLPWNNDKIKHRSHTIWRHSIMESSQYFIAKSDKYVLVRKIGNRFFRIISDTNITPVELIYQKICSEGYTSEQELFQDIFDLYGNISIFSFNKGNDSTLPK